MGVDLDEEAGEEDVGGWAAEMLFLRHRHKPEPHMMGEELETFYEKVVEPRIERLEQILDPSAGHHAAFDLALRLQRDRHRHGPPNAGGRRAQPAWWLFVVDCVDTCVERAESLTSREEAAINKKGNPKV